MWIVNTFGFDFGLQFFLRYAVWGGFLFALLGCTQLSEATPSPAPTAPPTAVALPTLAQLAPATATVTTPPAPTATAIATPTATPTPSPTAVPVSFTGDPRADLLRDPLPHSRNLCGVIDLFDFPIDPPHARTVRRGGVDFGVFRQRYDKYHAGEDWGGPDGQPTLGTAVYSIGHGVVTYAQPLGWGRDQGVVIVQHNYEDGTPVLSFYGHLAPESVTLKAGDCVARGDMVGQIGQPRSSPHLHFEVRTQAPYATLTGYWPEDPTTQGWLPPSAYIWGQRLQAAPGVSWTRPWRTNGTTFVGQIVTNTVTLLEDGQLVTLNVDNGREDQLTLPDLEQISTAVVWADTLFVADGRRQIRAYALPDLTPRWATELPTPSRPTLLPLPDGGLLLFTPQQLLALDANGQRRWTATDISRPTSHAQTEDTLFFTTGGSSDSDSALWQLALDQPEQPLQRRANIGGKLALTSDALWLYHTAGVYRLPLSDVNHNTPPRLVLPLPRPFLPQSDLHPLPDGGLLLAHRDLFDSRLLALDDTGHLRWERSIGYLGADVLRWQQVGSQTLLITEQEKHRASELFVYEVQTRPVKLTRLLHGGTRTAVVSETWATTLSPGQLLLHIGGGHLFPFTPR